MLRMNHFPVKPDLLIMRSCYRPSNPRRYCRELQRAGWEAVAEAGQVIVYHDQKTEPDAPRQPDHRESISASQSCELYHRALNAIIGQLLRRSGFIRVGSPKRRREYISPSEHVRSFVVAEGGPHLPPLNVRAHLRWTWELERWNDSHWLVPLPSRRFLTAQEPHDPVLDRWLRQRLAEHVTITGIDLQTGRHLKLTLRKEQWGALECRSWYPLDGDGWRICLNMKALEELGYSVEGSHAAEFSFEGLHAAVVNESPFGKVVTTTDPHSPADGRADTVTGAHLHFRKGVSRDMKAVHCLGILEDPPRPVRLLTVASQKASDEEHKHIRRIFAAHLVDRSTLTTHPGGQACLQAVGASDGRDTIATIWTSNQYRRGLNLPAFSLANTKLHLYDAKTGELVSRHALVEEAELAAREGVTLIALVLLEDSLPKPKHDRLMSHFRGMKALPIKVSSIAKRTASVERGVDPKWLNLTLQLAEKAGAVPWDLTDLPSVDQRSVFLGIDLGHDHARDRSQIGFTLFDHRGRFITDRMWPCGRNVEQIPTDILLEALPKLLFESDHPSPDTVVVHRDGRYCNGEPDHIIEALSDDVVALTLVAIKKDTCTRLNREQIEGTYVELDEHRTILVTNTQALHRSMPDPIEVELVYSNHQSLQQAVSQAFWLTRIWQGSVSHPKRLPATTWWADRIAATGRRRYLEESEHRDLDPV